MADINLRGLKEFVTANLPKETVLRDIILNEKDTVSAQDFLAKLEIWSILLRRMEK